MLDYRFDGQSGELVVEGDSGSRAAVLLIGVPVTSDDAEIVREGTSNRVLIEFEGGTPRTVATIRLDRQ